MRQEEANFASALVVLKDGKRLGWKMSKGIDPETLSVGINLRYYGGHDPWTCSVETRRFDGTDCFDEATRWAGSFDPHPDERGYPPFFGRNQ